MNIFVKRSLWGVSTILLVAAVLVGRFIWQQPQMWNDSVIDTVAPVFGDLQQKFKVLSFSKTNGFRHHKAIPAANSLLGEISEEQNWSLVTTENAAVFNKQQLAQFDVVIFNNVTKPNFTEQQAQALQHFIENGGGFVGIHAAGDGSHKDWPWYVEQVIRADFTMHPLLPQLQPATLYLESSHPVTAGLPLQWSATDEWYSFKDSVRSRGSQVLLAIDEETYDPNQWPMGDDHPLVWAHQLEQGRVLYSALGHTEDSYKNEYHRRLILQAIIWVGIFELE